MSIKALNKILLIPSLLNQGFDILIYKVLKNLGIKLKYHSILERTKYFLEKKIIKLTKKKVISGIYKNLNLNCKSNWGGFDFSSKLLGTYEEQVQQKIRDIAFKNKLKNIVQFGSADGYHILGLLKNNIFQNGYAFEKDQKSYKFSLDNKKRNRIGNRLKIFNEEANLDNVKKKYFDDKNLKKTLFLIDIEGAEYCLFKKSNIEKYKKSFFIIEDHDFIPYKRKRKQFLNLVNKIFNISFLNNSTRDPFKYNIIKKFSDDEKWLMMSESRPESMRWIVMEPKN